MAKQYYLPGDDGGKADLFDQFPAKIAKYAATFGLLDAIWFEVDRDGKGFAFLAVDTVPDYADTAPFPAGGAVWKYRAIYLLNDQKVGQWSATVSVRVG